MKKIPKRIVDKIEQRNALDKEIEEQDRKSDVVVKVRTRKFARKNEQR